MVNSLLSLFLQPQQSHKILQLTHAKRISYTLTTGESKDTIKRAKTATILHGRFKVSEVL